MVRLSQIHPVFYHLRVQQKRIVRHASDLLTIKKFATERSPDNLLHKCKSHKSLLRRKLGTSDPSLQEGKIVNLQIAHQTIDGILIKPHETFSFWKLLGKTTSAKGYVEGLQLSRGEVRTGIGGGLCQLANLLYWLALHSPLEVVERHHHSFDPFPDERRVLPFGSGASVFYNYVDLRFYNPTDITFQIRVWLTEDHLKGAIYSDREWIYTYHIVEKNHRFLQQDGKNYRENEIWRKIFNRHSGELVKEELAIKNFSEVKYALTEIGDGE
jgi:vancomycin resistance protein VanW